MKLEDVFPYLMRPPGDGIFAVSSGFSASANLKKKYYLSASKKSVSSKQKASKSARAPLLFDVNAVEAFWRSSLQQLSSARAALIGVPSDTGAGIRKGAAYGPRGVREALLNMNPYRSLLEKGAVVDLGDIFCNPHLLSDEMLSKEQIILCQNEMYSRAPLTVRETLSVSPLSSLEQLLRLLLAAHPHLKTFMIGGDHSVAWPVTKVLHEIHGAKLGIVQMDAHTDLLESRLGVRYCFGTWTHHAAVLLHSSGQRNNRLFQFGNRISGHDRAHWENKTGIRQVWAKEVTPSTAKRLIQTTIKDLKAAGVEKLYFTNDIDGTDEKEAPSTGTPEPKGLSSRFVRQLIVELGKHFDFVGADVVEVAPPLGPTPAAALKTSKLAAQYALDCLLVQSN